MPTFDVFVAYMPWMLMSSTNHGHDCYVPPQWFTTRDAESARAVALRYALPELPDVAIRTPMRRPVGLVVVPSGSGLCWLKADIEAAQDEAEQQRLEEEERAEYLRLKAKYEPAANAGLREVPVRPSTRTAVEILKNPPTPPVLR